MGHRAHRGEVRDPARLRVEPADSSLCAEASIVGSSSLPLSIRLTQGLEAGQDAAHLVDRDASTSCSFAGQSASFIAEAPAAALATDYAVTRSGSGAATQWTLYACTSGSYPCTDWAAISQTALDDAATAWPGAVPVHVDSALNTPAQFFRVTLPAGTAGPVSVSEFALEVSGLPVDAAMYPAAVVTVGEEVALQPQPFEGEAVFAIHPALPASLALDPASGAITGQGAGHFPAHWNVFTVLRTLGGQTARFSLVLVDGALSAPR